MCCTSKKDRTDSVQAKFNSEGQVESDDENNLEVELPEHVDNLLLNRNVHNGVLGFRYENKNYTVISYTSIEAKTFCMIMQITPIKK